jgi:hypothetical protein
LRVSETRIIVISTVRNVSKTFDEDFKHLSKALSGFSSVDWILVESDSTDNTIDVLSAHLRYANFRLISLGNLSHTFPSRVSRIAYSRNKALELLSNKDLSNPNTYIILADLDGRNRFLSKSAITSCWRFSDWDVCSANQLGPYYDIWALRAEKWQDSDCWSHYRALINLGMTPKTAYFEAVLKKMRIILPWKKPLLVYSAYGGLSIYKSFLFQDFKYPTDFSIEEETCDHFYMNEYVNSIGGRIYINPRMINHISLFSFIRLVASWSIS